MSVKDGLSQRISKQDLLDEGVDGQKLVCRSMGDVEDRFLNCELDGTELPLPTDRVDVRLDRDDQVSAGNGVFFVNPFTTFRTDEPRIHVECGFSRKESEAPDVDEFCVLEVSDAEE